ncbi:cytochrome P450 [Chondromyces crocatus]|uniref:Cytochrome P450 n=2 Tax=Chondromyces crocatus TaxID=52 RepID=A0A0K1EL12_CHOCO|nr:cytochrome P450 [Chondromyces crocatus]AKT41318.1 cytochrome P450 [Chondromyces crocatus]
MLPSGPTLPGRVQLFWWMFDPTSFMERCTREHGDTFTTRFTSYPPSVYVTDPEVIKQVFVASAEDLSAGQANTGLMGFLFGERSVLSLDGAQHLRSRRLVLPPFHNERLGRYGRLMREITDQHIDRWPIGKSFSVSKAMHELTFDVILRLLFGVHERAFYEPFSKLVAELVRQTTSPLFHGLFAMLPPEWVMSMLTRGPTKVALGPLGERDLSLFMPGGAILQAKREIGALIHAEISLRRASSQRGDDVLSMLLDARDENGEGMSDDELHDQLITLFIAGHDTTANALSWAVHHLLQHREVRGKLDDELSGVKGEGAGWLQEVAELAYLDAFIKETMRLTPVAPVILRILQRPLRFGQYDLPAGSYVCPCVYLTHRRADLWPEPERFLPERFIGRRVSPYEFFPFGGGARRCLGAGFSMYEMKVILARLVARAALRPVGGGEVRPERRGIFLAPSSGVPVVLEGRREA